MKKEKTEKILCAVFIIGACLYCGCLFYGMYQIDPDYNYDFEAPPFQTYPHQLNVSEYSENITVMNRSNSEFPHVLYYRNGTIAG